jgi:hypothetical protein
MVIINFIQSLILIPYCTERLFGRQNFKHKHSFVMHLAISVFYNGA